jgi:hypothetical protein
MALVIVWVVDSGTPNPDAPKIVIPAAAWAAKPCQLCSRVMRHPMVRMIRQPPADVPAAIVKAHTTITHHGIVNVAAAPPMSNVVANTPMNFCPSFNP